MPKDKKKKGLSLLDKLKDLTYIDSLLDFYIYLTDLPDIGPATVVSRIPHVFLPIIASSLRGGVGVPVVAWMVGCAIFSGWYSAVKSRHTNDMIAKTGSIKEIFLELKEKNPDSEEVNAYLNALAELEEKEAELATKENKKNTLKSKLDRLEEIAESPQTKQSRGELKRLNKDLNSINKTINDLKNEIDELKAEDSVIRKTEEAIQKLLDKRQLGSTNRLIIKVDHDLHSLEVETNENYVATPEQQNEELKNFCAFISTFQDENPQTIYEILLAVKHWFEPNTFRIINLVTLSAMIDWLSWWIMMITIGPEITNGFIGTTITTGLSLLGPTIMTGLMTFAGIHGYMQEKQNTDAKRIEAEELSLKKHEHIKINIILDGKCQLKKIENLEKNISSIKPKRDMFAAYRKLRSCRPAATAPTIEDIFANNKWKNFKWGTGIFDRLTRGYFVLTQFFWPVPNSTTKLTNCSSNDWDIANKCPDDLIGTETGFGLSWAIGFMASAMRLLETPSTSRKFKQKEMDILDTACDIDNKKMRDVLNQYLKNIHDELNKAKSIAADIPQEYLGDFSFANDPSAINHYINKPVFKYFELDPVFDCLSAFGSYIYLERATTQVTHNSFQSWQLPDIAIPVGCIGVAIRLISRSSEYDQINRENILNYVDEVALMLKVNLKTLKKYNEYLSAVKQHLDGQPMDIERGLDEEEPLLKNNIPLQYGIN